MLINMAQRGGSTLEEQLSSIMDVHAKAAVSEIGQLFSEGSAALRLQVTRSLRENETLRARMKGMRSELLSLRLQARANAARASGRSAPPARDHICTHLQTTHLLGDEDCDAFGDGGTQHGATSESLRVDAPPGSSLMSGHSEELRILSVHGKGEGPLALNGHDTLLTVSKVEAPSSLSGGHSGAESLEGGERSVRPEELSVQQTPDTISIKVEEDLGGDKPAVEDCKDLRGGATSEALRVDAPGSSHMSGHSGELRILSVHGKGEGPLALDGRDALFTASEPEAPSSLPADHSGAKILDCSVRLVHHEELTGHRGGRKGQPRVLLGKGLPDNTKTTVLKRTHKGKKPYGCDQCKKCFPSKSHLAKHMRTHTGEKPFKCHQCMKSYQQKSYLKTHMRTHTGEKPYSCDQCRQSYQRKDYLKVHMRTHTGEKPFKCHQCMKGFQQKGYLKIHMRTHSGERPYKCDQCLKGFQTKDHLKSHMRTHSGEKPYSCEQCMKLFGQKSSLKLHMKIHGEKPCDSFSG